MRIIIKSNLYGDDIIYEIRDELQENDPIMYDKWKENKFDLDYMFYGEYTLLHLAAGKFALEMAKALVEGGANVDIVDDYGETPLYSAVQCGDMKMVKFLIESGANVNVVNEFDSTLLHEAVQQTPRRVKILIAETLIENGASVNVVDQIKKTPLHFASASANIDAVKVMIKNGADVGAVCYNGNTPLHEAACSGATDVVRVLIESGANVNVVNRYKKQAPLHLAAEHNHLEVVKYLAGKGADLRAKDVEGKVPLDYAREKGHREVAKYLKSKIAAEISESQREPAQTSKKVYSESVGPEVLFGIDSMPGEPKKGKSKCLIQSSQAVNLSLSEFLSPYSRDVLIEPVEQGIHLPSFKARNMEVDGKCVSITRGLSQSLFLQCEKSFLSNLKTSAKIYERIAQGKQISKREEREVFAFSKLLDSFEQKLDSSVNSLPSSLMHNQSYSTLGDLSNYTTEVKGDFAIHLVTSDHVVAIYRIGDNYAYFDSNIAFVSSLKSVMQVVKKGIESASYKVEEKGFLVEHFGVEQANNLLSNEDKKILANEIKTECQLLAEQDKEFGLIKVNGQDISRVQLYDFGTKVSVEGSVPLLINADMNLNNKNFSEYLSAGRVTMTAREYLDSLKNSKGMEEIVQATKFIPFIGSKSEVEKAEQTREPKGYLAKEIINCMLSAVSLANIGQLKGQSSADTSTKPDSYLSEVKVDNQPEKSLPF